MKKTIKITIISLALLFSGCIKRDSFEGITVYTTVYPIEYVTDKLYGENSTVHSIYPDGIKFESYKLNKKQIADYSTSNLFVFNSLSHEKEYVIPMFNLNDDIKIIDATATMDIENDVEELWMDPSNFLKMISNVHLGLHDYITNQYIKSEIDKRYDELRLEISSLDATLRQVTKNALNNTIVVGDDLYLFLNKYNFNVISLDGDLSDKTKALVTSLINDGTISYIFVKDETDVNENVKYFTDNFDVDSVKFHTLSNLSEEERGQDRDYLYLMNENIEKLKNEIFE